MSCIKENYSEWRKKVYLAFVCAKVDWVVETPQPVKPTESLRDEKDDDSIWERKTRDYAPLEMSYTLENIKWLTANKKCMAFIKKQLSKLLSAQL